MVLCLFLWNLCTIRGCLSGAVYNAILTSNANEEICYGIVIRLPVAVKLDLIVFHPLCIRISQK